MDVKLKRWRMEIPCFIHTFLPMHDGDCPTKMLIWRFPISNHPKLVIINGKTNGLENPYFRNPPYIQDSACTSHSIFAFF